MVFGLARIEMSAVGCSPLVVLQPFAPGITYALLRKFEFEKRNN
jgi:hypothetical protein